jgi:zinc/manganese transport system permease protein
MGLSAGIATASMALGLALSFLVPTLPPSFCVLALATAAYVAAHVVSAVRRRAA